MGSGIVLYTSRAFDWLGGPMVDDVEEQCDTVLNYG